MRMNTVTQVRSSRRGRGAIAGRCGASAGAPSPSPSPRGDSSQEGKPYKNILKVPNPKSQKSTVKSPVRAKATQMELKDRIDLLIDAGSGEFFEDETGAPGQWKYSGVDERHVGTPVPITPEEKELVGFMGGNYNRELAKLYFEKRPVTVMVKFAKMMRLGLKVAYEWRRQESLPEDERTRERCCAGRSTTSAPPSSSAGRR